MGSSSNVRDDESLRPDRGCPVSTGESHETDGEGSGIAGCYSCEDAGNAGSEPSGDESAGAATNPATDPVTEAVRQSLETAREEQAAAQISFLEARARISRADQEVARLEAAYAALTGKAPVAAEADKAQEAPSKPKNPRKTRNNENNPLAHLKCAGCGKSGSMSEQIIQAPSGAYVRMLICGECRNQSLMG